MTKTTQLLKDTSLSRTQRFMLNIIAHYEQSKMLKMTLEEYIEQFSNIEMDSDTYYRDEINPNLYHSRTWFDQYMFNKGEKK